jgi:hypothetical protein
LGQEAVQSISQSYRQPNQSSARRLGKKSSGHTFYHLLATALCWRCPAVSDPWCGFASPPASFDTAQGTVQDNSVILEFLDGIRGRYIETGCYRTANTTQDSSHLPFSTCSHANKLANIARANIKLEISYHGSSLRLVGETDLHPLSSSSNVLGCRNTSGSTGNHGLMHTSSK